MAKVTLLTYTPEPERVIAAAAKLCYSPSNIDTIMDKQDQKTAADFVAKLMNMGHESPIEHVSFTFGIEGVSRTLLAQITRHRIASYSVQSQRYVSEKNFEYVIPPEIEADNEARDIFLNAMKQAGESYDILADILTHKHMKNMMEAGADEKTAAYNAKKKAIEDARFVLPNACDTKMMVTMNARGLMNFFRHRLCNRAQWEIRDVALEMYKLVYREAPSLFKFAGPACVLGPCPEGEKTCGERSHMIEMYRSIREELER